MHWKLAANFAIALLAILNPLGVLPLFIEATKNETKGVRRALAVLISVAVFLFLFVFLLFGNEILGFFGISIPAFRIAGGILILLIGIQMVFGKREHIQPIKMSKGVGNNFQQAAKKMNGVLVPLTIPIFVGPGSIGTVIMYSHKTGDCTDYFLLIAALFVVSLIVLLCFVASEKISKLLGNNGIQIATCILGLLLSSVAVQFMIDGIAALIPGIILQKYVG